MQAGRRLYFHGQYATCKQGEDLPSPLSEHLQRFGNWTWHPKFLRKSVNCALQWVGIWLGKIYQLGKNRSLVRIYARVGGARIRSQPPGTPLNTPLFVGPA